MISISEIQLLQTFTTPPAEIPYGVRMLGAPLEWAETKGQGIKVAVLDTGRLEHPDIKVADSFASSNLRNSHDELDHNGHSTHVCGTICANGKIKGVAPEVELYTAKVLDDTEPPGEPDGKPLVPEEYRVPVAIYLATGEIAA